MALRTIARLSPFAAITLSKPPLIFPKLSLTSRKAHFSVMATTVKKSVNVAVSWLQVLVPIAHGTEPMEAVAPIDILRRAGAEVTVASVEKRRDVTAYHDVKIVADALVDDVADEEFDLIALPGGLPGGAETLRDCEALKNMVKKQAASGRPYAAICAAPALALEPWGLVKGLKATCYPSFMEKLSSSATTVESRVHQDAQHVTSRGPGTSMEFGVALVELLFGQEKAAEVSEPLVMRPNHGAEYTIRELNPMKWKFDSCPKILVPIANGTEEMEVVMMIDVLRWAEAEVVVASVEDKLEILASRQVKLVADMLIDEAAKLNYDLIVLPGGLGGAQAFAKSDTLVNLLKKQKESNRPYGALCASPALVLEPHGLLEGKKATAFPALCSKLPDASEAANRVVIDGNLITSRGPGTTLEFSLAIVEKLFGPKKAIDLAKGLLVVHS
ncbi:hypothetical protein RJ640_004369 [Escallonia rubra]|uniref:DJ-1/PfpI domain-containing protein n=1 Tax=Escallonia rubra TaxID=112253 RepID=A0AA88RC41_9ASTE|nr:hypothetical protein RJ640_004369 [Escallonia rubra]